MKMLSLVLVLSAALIFAPPAAASGTACFDWSCDPNNNTGACTINASCSTASPYIWKYAFNFGDGSSTGLTGNATQNHTYASGIYESDVAVTIYFFSSPDSDTVSCTINVRFPPVGPQPPPSYFQGRCSN